MQPRGQGKQPTRSPESPVPNATDVGVGVPGSHVELVRGGQRGLNGAGGVAWHMIMWESCGLQSKARHGKRMCVALAIWCAASASEGQRPGGCIPCHVHALHALGPFRLRCLKRAAPGTPRRHMGNAHLQQSGHPASHPPGSWYWVQARCRSCLEQAVWEAGGGASRGCVGIV